MGATCYSAIQKLLYPVVCLVPPESVLTFTISGLCPPRQGHILSSEVGHP
jgi:hypothetical protein